MASVMLLWVPLGAGGHVVRWSGRCFEAVLAARDRRPRTALHHAALLVDDDSRTWAVEVGPAAGPGSGRPGVVGVGPVGLRVAGRHRWFRYEVRRRPDGVIPDAAEAVQRLVLSRDRSTCSRLVSAVPDVPLLVWGRDQVGAGEMWNSNSVVAWLLERAGVDATAVVPPPGGSAPGWAAGVLAARAAADRTMPTG